MTVLCTVVLSMIMLSLAVISMAVSHLIMLSTAVPVLDHDVLDVLLAHDVRHVRHHLVHPPAAPHRLDPLFLQQNIHSLRCQQTSMSYDDWK